MKKINAIPGSIQWNGKVFDPKLIIHFQRTENSEWYEIHINLSPDFVRDISLALKKYIASWWKSKLDKMAEVQKHLKF